MAQEKRSATSWNLEKSKIKIMKMVRFTYIKIQHFKITI